MKKLGWFAAVLAASSGAAVIGSAGSPAFADSNPIIDIIDGISPSTNLLPLNVSPTVLCIPTASNVNSVKGDNNHITTNQTNNCTQSAQQTTPPPPNGGFSGYEVRPAQSDECAPGEVCSVSILCPEGKNLISGYYQAQPGTQAVFLSATNSTATEYDASFVNTSQTTATLSANATCADVTP
ncbi:hypothetical protein ACIHFD_31525 [Nonomuraea sp. NPDC051941]|uniref:hypothetical protein n=1 Tax=Nonomuraea sp. NPDC051941 TaxID=3364373 RepID=UPI0037C62D69